jgi:hypothetical protein
MTDDEQKTYDDLKAHNEGINASLLTLQVRLDDALQKHADDAAMLAAFSAKVSADVEALKAEHAGQLDAARKGRESDLAKFQASMDTLKSEHAAVLAETKSIADFKVAQYELAHREALAILSESPDARLLRVQHAQEAAALAQKQEQARAALAGKLG